MQFRHSLDLYYMFGKVLEANHDLNATTEDRQPWTSVMDLWQGDRKATEWQTQLAVYPISIPSSSCYQNPNLKVPMVKPT